MRAVKCFVVMSLMLAAVPAAAQDEKKVNFNFGGGYTFSMGEVRKHLGDGYNVNFGVTYNATPTVGFQVEYTFNGLGDKEVKLPVSPTPGGGATDQTFFAGMSMQSVTLSLVLRAPTQGAAKPYLLVGGGYYYRPVTVTTPSAGYLPGYCNPWWYVCYPGGWVPIEEVVGERSSHDVGLTVGAGVSITISDSASVYLESRYHYIWGPTVENPANTSDTRKANGQFFPLSVGLRF